MLLTKTNFMSYLDCPVHLWLEKIHKELVPPFTAEVERLFAQGHMVDDKARELFPGGVEVQGYNFDGHRNTQRLLASTATVLYQPTIVVDDLSCRADILVRSGDGWDLHEVKMSAGVTDGHYNDATFQTILFRRAGVKINKTFVTYINNKYVRAGDIDVTQLFIDEDVSSQVAKRYASIEALIPKAKEVFTWGGVLRKEHIASCADPRSCEWIKLWTDSMSGDVRDALLADASVAAAKELPPLYIDKEGIATELAGLQYPLYFFDYETHSSPIPSFDGYRPYQQIPFQFSLYIIPSPDGTPMIHDFLMKTFEDPVPALLEFFAHVMGREGSVISWYAPFEKARNDEMALTHPEYADLLADVNSRTYDLMDIFKKGFYTDPAFGGSNSLKKVMPVLAPELSYKNLAIQEGGTASASWAMVTDPSVPEVKREKLYNDMIQYCQLDVYAMVRILDVVRERVK
ncbi:MAG: DUF2779 domain-containing protein [bacterium]|nr:DUF2779 domain-containing protein [bacterium]